MPSRRAGHPKKTKPIHEKKKESHQEYSFFVEEKKCELPKEPKLMRDTFFHFPESGLTAEESELIALYLNETSNPIPDVTLWEADKVTERDAYSYRLEIKAHSPIVCLRGIIFSGKPISELQELSDQDDQVKKYFEANFKDQYVYIKSQGYYYITDTTKLAELRQQAGKYFQEKLFASTFRVQS